MKKIYIIGQLPPPIHGLSKALNTLITSTVINQNYSIESLDIKDNKKIFYHIKEIIKFKADLYYFTISQTIFGNIRDMLILWVLLKKKRKVVIHYHGGYYKHLYREMPILQKWINKKLISKIDLMIALSNGLISIFEDVIEINKVKVCENFVEDNSLIEDKLFCDKNNQIQTKDKLEILYLSNFIKTKGYMDVLESAKLLKNNPNIIFNFAGAFFSEIEKEEFNIFIKENRLDQQVYYHGIVNGQKKKELLSACDVFVLPTYYPNEGQPISIIEAMGNGLTVISTKHAGIPDIVKKENGFLVNPRAPQEIADQINNLYYNRKLLKKIGISNREIVMSKYKEEDYIQRLNVIFNEVMKNAN